MTLPVDSATHCERDEAAENCDIEITQEMIDAGVRALVAYSPYFHLEEDGVVRIFRAMINARNLGK